MIVVVISSGLQNYLVHSSMNFYPVLECLMVSLLLDSYLLRSGPSYIYL